ncbi:MAG: baseplate J/gp47 family protein [Pyrinomonadaceae bacterium]
MAELTNTGYVLKPQNQWFDEERQLYIDIDPLWNLDPSTPDGLKIAHDAEIFAAFDEVLQQAYNSKDPNKAIGTDLHTIGMLTGSIPSEGSGSSVELMLTGTPGTVVPAGTRRESAVTGTRWAIDQTVTLDGAGEATVNATCTTIGPTQADAGTITRAVDVVGGLTGSANAAPAQPGTGEQSDSSFRIERAISVGRPGNNQIDSMLGEIFATDGVRRVKVYENDTNSGEFDAEDNPYSLPAHSISPVIDGGTDADVAYSIYIKKNPGVLLHQAGTPFEVLVTSQVYPTNTKLIRASRPVYVDMVVVLELTDDGTLPANIDQLVTEAIVEFGQGELLPADIGFKITGFDIGESVPYSTMFTPINNVIGAYGNSYVSSLTVNGGNSNVAIAFNQLSRWTDANITVTVV